MIYSLKIINSADISESALLDIQSVLYIYLNYCPFSTLTFVAESLLMEICDGNGKNTMWTELLPRVIQIVVRNGSEYYITPENVKFLGYNYRTKFVEQLIKSSPSWKPQVIPEIASMLK